LRDGWPGLRVRRNYPYRGVNDCHQNSLRRRFPDPTYLALEFEVNQVLLPVDSAPWRDVRDAAEKSLREVMADFDWWDGGSGFGGAGKTIRP